MESGIDFKSDSASEEVIALAKIIRYYARRYACKLIDGGDLPFSVTDEANIHILKEILFFRFEKILSGSDAQALGLKRLIAVSPKALTTLAYDEALKAKSKASLSILRPAILAEFGEDPEFLEQIRVLFDAREKHTREYYRKTTLNFSKNAYKQFHTQLYDIAISMPEKQLFAHDKRYAYLSKSDFFPHFPESFEGYSEWETASSGLSGLAYVAYKSSPLSLVGSGLSYLKDLDLTKQLGLSELTSFSLSGYLGYGVEHEDNATSAIMTGTSAITGYGSTMSSVEVSSSGKVVAKIFEVVSEPCLKGLPPEIQSKLARFATSGARAAAISNSAATLASATAFTASLTLGVGISSYQTFSRGGTSDRTSWQRLKQSLKKDKERNKFFHFDESRYQQEMSFEYLDALFAFDTAFALLKLGKISHKPSNMKASRKSLKENIKASCEFDQDTQLKMLMFSALKKLREQPKASWDDFEALREMRHKTFTHTKRAKEFFPEGVHFNDKSIKREYKSFLASRLSKKGVLNMGMSEYSCRKAFKLDS